LDDCDFEEFNASGEVDVGGGGFGCPEMEEFEV
jgi:hypothetical protein